MKWYAGSDHAGFALKQRLVECLRADGDTVVDLGTDSSASVDYPDFGEKVARAVAADVAANIDSFGLAVCGTGIGISMAANKIAGIRAAVVTDEFTARATRSHNDANVICLGERVIGPGVAESAVRLFRDTAFEGGRHARRVGKISALDPETPPGKTG